MPSSRSERDPTVLSQMSKRPDVLALWSRLPFPTESATEATTDAPAMRSARRDRVVIAVARTMQRTAARSARRARVLTRLGVGAAMAAALAMGIAFWRTRAAAEPVVARLYTLFGASHALVDGREIVPPSDSAALSLASRSQVATEQASSSRLQLVSGVEIAVGPETRLTLPDAKAPSSMREEVTLELGFVRVQVPKLPRGHFFSIRTPNTLVSVHGTAFTVEVTKSGPSGAASTRVIVTDGVVAVQQAEREILLDAGTEWASSIENSADLPLGPRTATVTRSRSAGSPGAMPQKADREAANAMPFAPDAVTTRDDGATPTDLANQNRLFSEAMHARDQGDRAGAVRLLDEFIRRYPGAPLMQDAHVERFRVLAQMGARAAAVRAARAYLARYRNGFAQDEARALALDAPPDP